MKKTGFMFLNNSHQIYHAASIAFELSKLPEQNVVIYCSSETNLATVKALSANYLGPDWENNAGKLQVVLVLPSKTYSMTRRFSRRLSPGIQAIIKQHVHEFSTCDVLVSPAKDILKMKSLPSFKGKKFVYTHHGAGDREYGFSDSVAKFDLVFTSGQEIKNRFENMGILNQEKSKNMSVIGYPKFDLCRPKDVRKELNLFSNDNPVVLYNPHFKEDLSSWYSWGGQLIEIFKAETQFNFIVAPHIALATTEKRKLEKLCRDSENIYLDVDVGSNNLIDMTYTIHSDIYLGDVSSQVYEFLFNARPCVFLNPNAFSWQEDPSFSCWQFGEVIESLENVSTAINQANSKWQGFRDIQNSAFEKRFHQPVSTPSKFGAELISNL